jgi:hypothetical protein
MTGGQAQPMGSERDASQSRHQASAARIQPADPATRPPSHGGIQEGYGDGTVGGAIGRVRRGLAPSRS